MLKYLEENIGECYIKGNFLFYFKKFIFKCNFIFLFLAVLGLSVQTSLVVESGGWSLLQYTSHCGGFFYWEYVGLENM